MSLCISSSLVPGPPCFRPTIPSVQTAPSGGDPEAEGGDSTPSRLTQPRQRLPQSAQLW